MLAVVSHQSALDHQPRQPSPLSPRHHFKVLAHSPDSSPMSSFPPDQQHQPQRHTSPQTPHAHRPAHKPNPLFQRSRDASERRRGLFLKKVREDGEERRWRARGGEDEVMRSIFLAERRRWEAMQATCATGVPPDDEDVEMAMEGQLDSHAEPDLPDDEREVQGLVELLVAQDSGDGDRGDSMGRTGAGSVYGSDDDDYDRLFLEMIEQSSDGNVRQGNDGGEQPHPDEEMMDTSGA